MKTSDAILHLHEQGYTPAEIADRLLKPVRQVRQCLVDRGKLPRRAKKGPDGVIDLAQLRELVATHSYSDLATIFNVHLATVKRTIDKEGLHRPPVASEKRKQ
jgi:DNA-directed RNA polymerase specialized sigma24 family protein